MLSKLNNTIPVGEIGKFKQVLYKILILHQTMLLTNTVYFYKKTLINQGLV